MTQTPPVTDRDETTILQRIAVPFLSFGGVLFATLFLSHVFVLPRVTTLTVGDLTLSIREATAYERSLRAEVAELEHDREELVLPMIDDRYDALMTAKRDTPNAADLLRMIRSTMQSVASDVGATAVIDALHVDSETGVVVVDGHIDDPHPSSMAVLAAAVDAVGREPWVADLTPPALTRQEIPGGYRSPFRFQFHRRP